MKAPALPDLRLWMPGGRFESPPDRWDRQIVRSDAQIREDEHPKGAHAVLRILEAHASAENGWVSLDVLMAESGQRAVHSRIAELRKKHRIEWNRRSGGKSRYRLLRDGDGC